MFAFLFDLTHVIPFAVFGAFATLVWIIADHFLQGRRKAEERLEQMDRGADDTADGGRITKVSSTMTELVEKAAPAIARPLESSDLQEISKLRLRLSCAGFRSELAGKVFHALKILCLGAGYFLGGGAMLFSTGFTIDVVLRVVLVAGLMFYLPDFVLLLLTKHRHQKLFLGLPDTLDLIVVCVEAGLGLDQAMRKVAAEMKKAHPVVAHEFEMANMQLQMGLDRIEVLRELGRRNGEDSLSGLVSVLIQASRFGSSIGEALRTHSDAMRTRRRQIADEKASKCAVKLVFPLVLFIFPGIFVVLVGPAAIAIVEHLMPVIDG
jgi:tight adherence protein C